MAGSIVASVSSTLSIVAIRGWIIPTPLAMPETRTVTEPPAAAGSSTVVVTTFVRESVVRSAIAAASRPASLAARPSATIRSIPGRTRSSGRRVPMIPVDIASAVAGGAPTAAARPARIARWSASPAAPVAAFALPDVETTPVAQPQRPSPSGAVVARFARLRRTGAAAIVFGVKTAAAAAGIRPSGPRSVVMTARSGRPDALIPTVAPPARNPRGIAARRSTGGSPVGGARRASSGRCRVSVMGRAGAVRGRPSRAGRTRR